MDPSLFIEKYNLILIRYSGEIWLKSTKVKMRMVNTLMNNITKMLNRADIKFHKYQLSKDSSRIFYFFDNEDILKALFIIKKVFGVYSVSPALRTSNRIKNIKERTLEVAEKVLKKGESFALRVKRSGVHDYTSQDVAVEVGAEIMEKLSNLNLSVDLTNPKKEIFIEIRNDFSYIFTEIFSNYWEGLPYNKKNKILAMDCGRIEDLLASFLLMRRGVQILPVLFNISDTEGLEENWRSNWNEVRRYIPSHKFAVYQLDLGSVMKKILNQLDDKTYTCAICRLLRFDLSAKLTKQLDAFKKVKAFSDGLSLNNKNYCFDEVDLQSIALNYLFSDHPIFTSIVALDSSEINNRITNISENLKKHDYCKFKPENQEIDLKELKGIYDSLDTNSFLQKCIHNIKEFDLS